MKYSLREIYRYMGLRAEPDATLAGRIASIADETLEAARPRSAWRVVDVKFGGSCNLVSVGGISAGSVALGRALRGCRSAFVFVATIGAGVDALMRKMAVTSSLDELAVQAAGASLIESYCDECCAKMAEEPEARGKFLRPRFSPGYGDFPIENQRQLLAEVDAQRRAGVMLTGSLMMVPTKSVSAIVGIGDAEARCTPAGCEACGRADCDYRRPGDKEQGG